MSMLVGGRGGLQRRFLMRSVLMVAESSLSPAKNVLMPMSRSSLFVQWQQLCGVGWFWDEF